MIVVGIATTGRPHILEQTLQEIARQTRLPDRIIVCPAAEQDLPESGFGAIPIEIEIVRGGRGLCAQRNAILDTAANAEIVVFFDDDFFPAPDFLATCENLFRRDVRIVIATGLVVVDGIKGPGIEPTEARRLLAAAPSAEDEVIAAYAAYGCNMAVRMEPIRRFGTRFDENLPLYGWQEDVDFSRQLAVHGRVVRSFAMRGVHLGHKAGRTSGIRIGYSQVANIWYLVRKGTMSFTFGGRLAVRNILANVVHSLHPEAYVDRHGRLRGNVMALGDILRGCCDPRRILRF